MVEQNPAKPVAFVLRRIILHDRANSDDFEQFMLAELFPAVNTSSNGEQPDQHFLLQGGADNEYVWLSRLEYWIHQTPLPQWLFNRVERTDDEVQERLQAFGTSTPAEVYYDVTAWRQRLGK